MTEHQEEIELIDGQIVASLLFFVNLLIALFLLYNQKLIETDQEPFLTQEQANLVNLYNRTFAIILLSYFLYTSYKEYQYAEECEKRGAISQIIAASLVLVASIIIEGSLLRTCSNDASSIPFENPEI